MKTFTKLKAFVDDPHYYEKREESLCKLQISTIDAPIVEIIKDFAKLTYCFTLQSCYGHFIHKGQENPKNVEPLSLSDFDKTSSIEYRIAYLALCIQNIINQIYQQFSEVNPSKFIPGVGGKTSYILITEEGIKEYQKYDLNP